MGGRVCEFLRHCLLLHETRFGGGGGVTHWPTTSGVGGSNLMWESWQLLTDAPKFTEQNLEQLYWFPLPIKLPLIILPVQC